MRFKDVADVAWTHDTRDYDRTMLPVQHNFTNEARARIESELNRFKRLEMEVHVASQQNTRYHQNCHNGEFPRSKRANDQLLTPVLQDVEHEIATVRAQIHSLKMEKLRMLSAVDFSIP